MSTLKSTFWQVYDKIFPYKIPDGVIDGAVCDQDILKCFEYAKNSNKYARAKADLLVYKATLNHEDDRSNDKSYSITSLTVPKGTRVHLGPNYQRESSHHEDIDRSKCRAEEARVVKADIRGRRNITWSWYTMWNGGRRVRMPYKNGETVKPSNFYDRETAETCDEDNYCYMMNDVTCAGGIHFFLRKDHADKYGRFL